MKCALAQLHPDHNKRKKPTNPSSILDQIPQNSTTSSKRKDQTSELTKWPLETGFRDTDRTRRLVSTLDKLRPTSLLSPDGFDPTPPFLETDLPLLSSTTPGLLPSALVPPILDSRSPEFSPPLIDFSGKVSLSGGESPLQKRGLSLLFKNSGDEAALEKALTLLDLLGEARLWASREAALTEGDGAAAPELAEAEAPLLEVDLKAETAINTEGNSRKEGRVCVCHPIESRGYRPKKDKRQKVTMMGMKSGRS